MRAIDKIAKMHEISTNGYRYPNSMIGRTQEKLERLTETDVLLFAAHPDDESLGLGTVLYRHRKHGDTVSVVFTTNGRGGSGWTTPRRTALATAKLRYQEACDALSVIGISSERICCLGFPDVGLYRYAVECMNDVLTLIRCSRPNKIYVHSFDGGHVDHDITNLIVRVSCKQLDFANLYEWPQYNMYVKAEDPHFVFSDEPQVPPIIPTEEERVIKYTMLGKYTSQWDVLQRYRHKNEAVRKACLSTLTIVPSLYSDALQQRALRATRDFQLQLSLVD